MALVEVVVGERTSEQTRDAAVALVGELGKEAVVVDDSPGFATSRLGLALGLEAIRMVEGGVAAAADIDKAMVLGYRHPVGPLRLTDIVGLDVRLDIARNLRRDLRRALRAAAAARSDGRRGPAGQEEWSGLFRVVNRSAA